MERTINGKTIRQVLQELAEPLPKEAVKKNEQGFPYVSVDTYRERMDKVVGVLNYDFVISHLETTEYNGKGLITCVGTLTIRDDNGNSVASKSSSGGTSIIVRNSDGQVVKASNDAKTATQDAFKSCCRMFGIADGQIREERGKQKKNEGKDSKAASGPASESLNAEKFGIKIVGRFRSIGKGFKADVVIKETGEKAVLVCWQDAVAEISKFMDFNRFIEVYVGKELHIYAVRSQFSMKNGTVEEQLIMVKPYIEKEERK